VTALRALLAGVVDYAGLFPPAALDMPTAVRNYQHYRAETDSWMLGRFVLPVSRLDEFSAALDAVHTPHESEWQLSALLGADPVRDTTLVRAFNASRAGEANIDVVEAKLDSADAIASAASAARGREGHDLTLYAELPIDRDTAPLVDAVKRARVNAKIRTGGVTPESIPNAGDVVRFMRACIAAGVAFKATAGLHHPLRAEQNLTYANDAPRAMMFGFLNVFLAAAFLEFGMTDDDARRVLEERDPASLTITSDTIIWRGNTLTAAQLRQARDVVAVSFGSCSFREPVDELHALSILG
jgi:hypothetical protein